MPGPRGRLRTADGSGGTGVKPGQHPRGARRPMFTPVIASPELGMSPRQAQFGTSRKPAGPDFGPGAELLTLNFLSINTDAGQSQDLVGCWKRVEIRCLRQSGILLTRFGF